MNFKKMEKEPCLFSSATYASKMRLFDNKLG